MKIDSLRLQISFYTWMKSSSLISPNQTSPVGLGILSFLMHKLYATKYATKLLMLVGHLGGTKIKCGQKQPMRCLAILSRWGKKNIFHQHFKIQFKWSISTHITADPVCGWLTGWNTFLHLPLIRRAGFCSKPTSSHANTKYHPITILKSRLYLYERLLQHFMSVAF